MWYFYSMTILYVKTIAAIALGFFAGLGVVYIFNRIPARWLCDYGETPSPELMDRSVQRIKGWPWRWIYAGGLACLCVRLIWTKIQHPPAAYDGLSEDMIQLICQSQLMLAGLAACWAMLIIGLADLKYMIIPGQFVIMLAIAGMGFLPLQENLWQPLGGLALGGGVMLLVALMGISQGGHGPGGCEAVRSHGSGSGDPGDDIHTGGGFPRQRICLRHRHNTEKMQKR